MKRILWLSATFILSITFGTLGLSMPAAEHSAPTKIEGASDRSGAPPDSGPLALATAAVKPLKIDPEQPSNKYRTNSALLYDREKVEVLARHITFPTVINQGEHMLSVELPNAGFLCLDAAFYAGRVQGLIWAMDRDAVLEHELHWTIDHAQDLFQSCLKIVLQEAFADQNQHGKKIQLKDVKEELAEQILIIQEALRFARDVKIGAAALSAGGN